MLQSHFYGNAKYLCREIIFQEIESIDGVDEVCKTLNKKDS